MPVIWALLGWPGGESDAIEPDEGDAGVGGRTDFATVV